MNLKISADSPHAAVLNLKLAGNLDTLTAPELEQFIHQHVDEHVRTLVMDLQQLHFVSSDGLRIFAKARRGMKAQDGKLYFVHLSPQVNKVFELVKAVPLNEIFADTEELDAHLATLQSRS